MDNSSNMTVNTTQITNQINPEHHYGLDKNKACLNNSCPSNTADIGCYIPAIDEIMRLNQGAPSVAHPNMTEEVQKSNDNPSLEQAEIAYEEGGSTSEEQPENINKYSGSLQNIPFIKNLKKIDTSIPVLPATPATTRAPEPPLQRR
mgnify:CR=1 FL=1